MHSHQRPATTRVWLGTLIVSVALSLVFVGSGPAQAAAVPASAPAVTSQSSAATTTAGRPCAASPHTNQSCGLEPIPMFSEGGCGFLQRCLYFSRKEQLIILAGGGATIAVLICGATALLGCAAASAVIAAALQWLSNRGGVCPTTKPKLKVRYFPTPSVIGCVA